MFGMILLFIPGMVMWIRYSMYAPVVLIEGLQGKAAMRRARELASRSWRTVIIVSLLQLAIPMTVSFFVGFMAGRAEAEKNTVAAQIYRQVLDLANIFVVPLISIVPALLYVKMRQLGGESLASVWAQIEARRREAKRVATAHAHAPELAHTHQPKDHHDRLATDYADVYLCNPWLQFYCVTKNTSQAQRRSFALRVSFTLAR